MPSKNIILAVKSLGHALTDNSCACTCKKWLLKRMKVISIASWCEMHQVFGNGFDFGCRRPSRERTLHLLRWVETPYHQTCISVTNLSRRQERSVPELFSKRKHGSISRVQLVLIVCFEEEFSSGSQDCCVECNPWVMIWVCFHIFMCSSRFATNQAAGVYYFSLSLSSNVNIKFWGLWISYMLLW